MSIAACKISRSGAVKVCRNLWQREDRARWAAETLQSAGYTVDWCTKPYELTPGDTVLSIATVRDRDGLYIGDVTYEPQLRAAAGAYLSGPGA